MRIQTNYVRRFHLHVDPEAKVLDCFRVEVIPAWELITQGDRQNVTLETLWKEALESVVRQQKRYRESGTWKHLKLHSPLDLQPFAVVIACEEAREKVRRQVEVDTLTYRCMAEREPATPAEHERRVRHLIDAWDGLEWLALQ
jgi:hypothetical protein